MNTVVWLLLGWSTLLPGGEGEWSLWSPRDEAKPPAEILPQGGRDGAIGLKLSTGHREHWIGCWQRSL
jgi:hypothetical protein